MTDMATMSRANGLPELKSRRTAPIQRTKVAARRFDLLPAVDRNIIPRLHAALRKDLQRPQHPLISGAVACQEDVTDFAELMLRGSVDRACDRIDAMRLAGRSLEGIYLKLLAPTACHLRELWSDDLCGYADLTFALCNLQAVLRRYAQDFYAEAASPGTGSRVLLVTPSGDGVDILTPMFGLVMMSHFFRREGWDATIERDLSCGSFRQTAGEWFDLVEVLAANDRQLDEIATAIKTIRRGSPNPSVGVIVCGQVFSEKPDYIRLVGADLMASDPLSSLSQAKSFVTRQTQSCRLS